MAEPKPKRREERCVSTITKMVWAMGASGFSPQAKLLLILAADRSGQDGCCFDLLGLAEGANLTDEEFKAALTELMIAGVVAMPKIDGEQCVELLYEGD